MTNIINLKERLLPPSSRSFHTFERNVMRHISLLETELQKLQQQNDELSSQLSELKRQSTDAHSYEQTRDMMLYWQLFKRPEESLEDTKKRFFRGLPKANGALSLFQKAETKLFHEFDSFCKANDILYWSASGTVLGAYLYHGMIPWDDDIDVMITRPDLERMQKLLIGNTRFRITVVWDWYVPCKQIRFRLLDNDNPVFIDLFPLDLVDEDPKNAWQKTQSVRNSFVKDLRTTFSGTPWPTAVYLYDKSELTDQIENLLKKYQTDLASQINITTSLHQATGLIRGIENIDETQSSGPYPINEWIPTIDEKYGTFNIPLPNSWRQYLTRLYGDYLQIPHDISSHEHIDNDYLTRPESLSALTTYLDDVTPRSQDSKNH